MSVLKQNRHTLCKLQIAVDAENLFIEIYKIYMGRDIGKRHRPYLCNRIINKILDVNDYIRTANVLNLYDEYERRHELQMNAIILIEQLISDLELSSRVIENINHEKLARVLQDCYILLSKIENWTEKDSERVRQQVIHV